MIADERAWRTDVHRESCLHLSGLRRHFDVRVMGTVVSVDGARISSTRLRALLADGHREQARRMHGWPDRGCLPGTVQ